MLRRLYDGLAKSDGGARFSGAINSSWPPPKKRFVTAGVKLVKTVKKIDSTRLMLMSSRLLETEQVIKGKEISVKEEIENKIAENLKITKNRIAKIAISPAKAFEWWLEDSPHSLSEFEQQTLDNGELFYGGVPFIIGGRVVPLDVVTRKISESIVIVLKDGAGVIT